MGGVSAVAGFAPVSMVVLMLCGSGDKAPVDAIVVAAGVPTASMVAALGLQGVHAGGGDGWRCGRVAASSQPGSRVRPADCSRHGQQSTGRAEVVVAQRGMDVRMNVAEAG